jgi:hypothetical protein
MRLGFVHEDVNQSIFVSLSVNWHPRSVFVQPSICIHAVQQRFLSACGGVRDITAAMHEWGARLQGYDSWSEAEAAGFEALG